MLPELNVADMKSLLDDAIHLNGIQINQISPSYVLYSFAFNTQVLLLVLLLVKSRLHAISIQMHIHVPGSL